MNGTRDTTMPIATAAQAPGYGELMRSVASLEDRVRREADEAERMRHLSDTLFDAFQAARRKSSEPPVPDSRSP